MHQHLNEEGRDSLRPKGSRIDSDRGTHAGQAAAGPRGWRPMHDDMTRSGDVPRETSSATTRLVLADVRQRMRALGSAAQVYR